ncbi:helix-turn-helix domain-containing protein, partial [Bacillus canaveralius]|uniref:helix-turn-helix domain-containing protein n=1 Tax=Bacillus canaveralius TaxID=1403243 RepID=UPI000F97E40B
KEVVQLFIDYEWNGNVRELQNTIERLVLTVPSQQIKLEHLPEKFKNSVSQPQRIIGDKINLKHEVEEFEKQIIKLAIENSATMKEASMKLGVDASTISRKIKKYNISIAKLQFLV